jgi:hypothetical protein
MIFKWFFYMVHLLFRIWIRIHNLKLRIRIRILQKVSDPHGSGSTTLLWSWPKSCNRCRILVLMKWQFGWSWKAKNSNCTCQAVEAAACSSVAARDWCSRQVRRTLANMANLHITESNILRNLRMSYSTTKKLQRYEYLYQGGYSIMESVLYAQ